jgi:diguanylate cyclase (GGDEF)-like protein
MSFPPAIELAAVDREIAGHGLRLEFAPEIEARFHEETKARRVVHMILSSFAAIVLYDLFLVNDWLALNDRFREMLVARLLIFTPVIIGFIIATHRTKLLAFLDWTTVAGGSLAVFLPMIVMIHSHSSHKLSYQYGSVLVIMFGTVIQRIRFRAALVAIAIMLTIQLTTTYLTADFDSETYVAIVSFFGATGTLLLIAIYFMERADRHTFLFALRARLLHDQILIGARTDTLTGLYNRRHLAEVEREIWTRTTRSRVSAILLDVDHFKLFNDSYGHLQGDECLRTLGSCIMQVVKDDLGPAFRFGGEEVLILLPEIGLDEARRIAERIQIAIAAASIPHPAIGDGCVVTASFGIGTVKVSETSLTDLIAAADTSLYAAKRAGRNQIWPPRDVEAAVAAPRFPSIQKKYA